MTSQSKNTISQMLAAITGRHKDKATITSSVGIREEPLAINGSVRSLDATAPSSLDTRPEPRLRVVAAEVTEDGPLQALHEQPGPTPKASRLELGPMVASSLDVVEEKLGFMLLQDGLITPQQLAQALDAQAASGHLLGRALLDQKAVTPAQLEAAIHAQNKGERPSTARILSRLGVPPHHIQAIVDREQQTHETLPAIMRDWGFLSEEGVARTIAIQHGLPYFPRTEIDNIALTSLRARNIAVTDYRGFVPIAFKEDGKRGRIAVLIADRNLRSPATSEFKNYDCAFMIASSNTIQTIYRRYFANTGEKVDALIKEFNDALAEKEDLSRSTIPLTLFMALLRHACYSGASDLQLFPSHDVGVVKIKIDGHWELLKVVTLDMLSRLFAVMRNNMLDKTSDEKLNHGFTDTALVMATDKDEQSQALREQYSDIIDRYVFRVEVGNPIQNGKTITVRVNDRQATASDLSQLGLDTKTLKKLRNMARAKSGVVILSGPTGSGKTTTIYGMLREMDSVTTSIQTLERPVEYTNGMWNQYPISAMEADEGMAWGEALKGILRNAPDVILLGEVRDESTARECFRAAMTGHLVLTTVHANGAAETAGRLMDLGIDSDKLANLLLGVLAQRLVRKLCAACKIPDERDETRQLLASHQSAQALRSVRGTSPYRARLNGCSECSNTGYRGRRAVYELMHASKMVRDMLESGEKISKLRELGLDGQNMLQTGLRLVAEGVTSVEELDTHVELDR